MLVEEDGVTAAWGREVLTLFASLYTLGVSLVAESVKNLRAVQEMGLTPG